MKLVRQINDQMVRKLFAHREQYLDIRAIQTILPHRYPFLLIDRIIDFNNLIDALG